MILTFAQQKRRRKGNSPPPGPNLNADYDPRIPNDYLAFKQTVHERRQAHMAHQRWLRDNHADVAYDQPPTLHSSPPQTSTQGRAVTGEDAYARRLAMSQPPPVPDITPPSVEAPPMDADLAARRSAAAAIAARLGKPESATDESAPFAPRLMS